MSARPMTYAEYQREGLSQLAAVFAEPNPYEPVLSERVETAAILYPLGPLTPEQFQALARAAAKVGDDTVYLAMLERKMGLDTKEGLHVRDPDLLSITENWLLPLDSDPQYEEIDGVQAMLDHALHSPHGRWAMLVSHESHAVVAGERSFVQALLESFPLDEDGLSPDSCVPLWLRHMRELWEFIRGNEANAWAPRLTLTIYGNERGRVLLAANGWDDFVRSSLPLRPAKLADGGLRTAESGAASRRPLSRRAGTSRSDRPGRASRPSRGSCDQGVA